MHHSLIICSTAIGLLGIVAPIQDPSSVRLGSFSPKLTEAQRSQAASGRRLFARSWNPDPNGVAYNAITCLACHFEPSLGGQVKNSAFFVNFVPDDTTISGWRIYQHFLTTVRGKSIERRTPIVSEQRRALPLYGLGALESIPENELRKRHDPFDKNMDGISGRSVLVDKTIGRFGWRADTATLDTFVLSAFRNEIGIPSADVTTMHSISNTDLRDVAMYIRALAPPVSADTKRFTGARVFEEIGCGNCHTQTLSPGVNPYSDLLLHDVESENPIHIERPHVDKSEFRTTPLWGLSKIGPPFWHDGSCATIEEAILKHTGEAKNSKSRFQKLNEKSKSDLFNFLDSL